MTATLTAAVLTFEPSSHVYALPDGRVVPSVTQVLKATGVSVDFDELTGLSTRMADQIAYRRDLGTAVHADCHSFDDKAIDWTTVDERVKPYILAWQICRENLGLEPLTRERRVFIPDLFVCGTLDGIFVRAGSRRRILIDLKIGDPEDAGAKFQTAGYELGWLAEHPDESIAERWSIRLCPDLEVPYRVTNYTAEPRAWEHTATFRAICTTYWAQAARRRATR